jgi:hypothetical protein
LAADEHDDGRVVARLAWLAHDDHAAVDRRACGTRRWSATVSGQSYKQVVAGLRRPPVSAWAANQLAHTAPNAVAELLEAGAALRQAQQDALAGQPGATRQKRTATAHLRAAITRLSSRAETLLVRAGMRPATPP